MWGSSGLLCLCGLSWCPFRLWLFFGAVPPGCSTLLFLPLPSPWLAPRAGSILMCSCTCLVRVCLPGGGPVCQGVAMCVFAHHHCFAAHRPSLVRGGRPSPSSWVRTSAGLLLSLSVGSASSGWTDVILLLLLGRRGCVFRGSFPSGFFSTSWFLVIVAFPLCPGLPIVALSVSWPVLLPQVLRWACRLVLRNVCRTLYCLVSHFARCLSPGAPPRT